MNKTNYQKELEKTIEIIKAKEKKPTLLLHSCCAPCSSYVLEYLDKYFDITVFYYNPNIYPEDEFYKRQQEQIKLIKDMGLNIKVIENEHMPQEFYDKIKGYENEKEGGERCKKCFELRLEKTCMYAKEHGFDYFTTTLSISPLKNAEALNETGRKIGEKYSVQYLFSDFKKNNGYKRSCELSNFYGIYRQNYCGCVYSVRDN